MNTKKILKIFLMMRQNLMREIELKESGLHVRLTKKIRIGFIIIK